MLNRRNVAVVMVCMAAVFLAGFIAQARDRSFASVLQGLKQDYHLKPQMPAGVWFAKCIVKAIPTPGVSKIDFVLFGQKSSQELATTRDLNTHIQKLLGSDWKPFVQMDNVNQEHAFIFARPNGHRLDLMVLHLDPDETVALFARVDAKGLKKWINH